MAQRNNSVVPTSVGGVSSVATRYEYRDTWSLKEKQVFEDYARYLKSEQDRVQLLYDKGPTDDGWSVKPPHPKKLRENKKKPRANKGTVGEQIQRKGEVFCGHLCLHVLKQLSLGRHLQDIVNDLY